MLSSEGEASSFGDDAAIAKGRLSRGGNEEALTVALDRDLDLRNAEECGPRRRAAALIPQQQSRRRCGVFRGAFLNLCAAGNDMREREGRFSAKG
jgi:hypothetical protein